MWVSTQAIHSYLTPERRSTKVSAQTKLGAPHLGSEMWVSTQASHSYRTPEADFHRGQRTNQASRDLTASLQLSRAIISTMAVIHISEAEAARTFTTLLAQVRAGDEVIIEDGTKPTAVLHAATPHTRSISDSIARAEAYAKEIGHAPVMDAEFASDLEEIVRNRKPRDQSAWE